MFGKSSRKRKGVERIRIKLEDLLAVANYYIAIMNGIHRSIMINVCHLEDLSLSDSLLKRNIKRMEAKDDIILVWLEGYGD